MRKRKSQHAFQRATRTFGAPVFTILTNRTADGEFWRRATSFNESRSRLGNVNEGRMPVEENSKASTAKTVMGFLAAVSLLVLMFLAFHNNAATVELAQRQTAIAEKLKELGKG